MPKMNVTKSKKISASIEKVYAAISDMNHWVAWSPWLIMEPGVNVNISGDKKYYDWEGQRVGSGNMKITDKQDNKWVSYDLNFIKPWKSKAKVRIELNTQGEGTDVKWTMDSSLPIFLFWMKKSMETYVGMDFNRGLELLKDFAEDGKIYSKLNFVGEDTLEGFSYLGVKTKTNQANVGNTMQQDFGRLAQKAQKLSLDMSKAFSIYHKFDPVKDKIEYTAAVPIDKVSEIPQGFYAGSIPSTKTYTLEHKGPYRHLGNAWSTFHSMIRGKELKIVKGIHPMETYHNDPQITDPKDLITRIHFALK